MKKCIVGILDTDFNITKYLAIRGKIYSMHVAKAMHLSLNKNSISHVYKNYENYARFYIPKKAAYKIINEWKMNNPKHLTKIRIFNEFRRFIPFTTTPERLALLSGKIDINELEKISKKRAEEKKNHPLS